MLLYCIDDYDYVLPQERIAQEPCGKRDFSRLLRLDRKTGKRSHHQFYELSQLLRSNDVLVINDTAVVPARLFGKKSTGGKVEVLVLDYAGSIAGRDDATSVECLCLMRSAKPCREDARIDFDSGLTARVISCNGETCQLALCADEPIGRILDRIGIIPLPPYIRRCEPGGAGTNDAMRYQTVYARNKGAVAAPTAGLHFTPKLLSQLSGLGVSIVSITLHVGYGTFSPVRVKDIRDHAMHSESFHLSGNAAETINVARSQGRRIVAVGTTVVRTLEYCSDESGTIQAQSGNCDLFIYPGYRFKIVDAMITNFHLPKSTLLMLVSAFADRGAILNAYAAAIREGYRFYSYGDAMLIE